MRPIHVAIVGCGRIADMHAPGYAGREDARIFAVCDTDPTLVAKRKQEWNAERVYTDYDALLADPDIDAIEILTPQKLHEPMVIAAARAKKHVALQKPMTIDLKKARRMIEAMKASGRVFRLTDNYIFYPPLVRLREMIDAGEIGTPTNLRIKFISGGLGGWQVPASSWKWRMQEREEGRGMQTFDHGHHLWAAATYLLGSIDRVHAWIDSVDGVIDSPAVVTWKYRDAMRYGMCEYVHAAELSIPSDYYANDEWFEVSGSRGVAIVRRCTGSLDTGPIISLFNEKGWQHFSDIASDWLEGFRGATQNFIESIQGKTKPDLDGTSGYEILRLSLAIQRSAIEHREVFVEELDSIWPLLTRMRLRSADRKEQSKEGWLARMFGSTRRYAPQAESLTLNLLERYDESQAKGWNSTIGISLLADGSAPAMAFGLYIADGKPRLEVGLPAEPVLSITIPAGTWAAILLGKKRIETAFLQGRLKVEGRLEEALPLRAAFHI